MLSTVVMGHVDQVVRGLIEVVKGKLYLQT